MSSIPVSATDLKHNTAEILNTVYFKKRTALIMRHGKVIAEIRPVLDTKSTKRSLADFYGILPEFPDVTKNRTSRKKQVSL